MKTTIQVACILLYATFLFAATPNWTRVIPGPDGVNIYFVGVADGSPSAATEQKAYEDAVKQIIVKLGGKITYKHRVLRHDELSVGESDIRFRSQVVLPGIQKVKVHRESETTWVLIGISSITFWDHFTCLQRAKAPCKNVQLYVKGTTGYFNGRLKNLLANTFTVTKDSATSNYSVTYSNSSLQFAKLGKHLAYRVTAIVTVSDSSTVLATKEFVEIGKGWSKEEAENDALDYIVMDAVDLVRVAICGEPCQ